MTISLDLTGDAERQLAETAKRLNVPVRDLAAAAVRDLLARPAEDFERAAAHVLSTNEALYRRLACVRYLTLGEVVELHQRLVAQTGGATSVRDLGALESAVAQPRMSAGGMEAYPTLVDKAAALGFSLIRSHPFVDGNKRVGHAAMATFLFLNGFELQASVEDAERTILAVAKSETDREALVQWLERHLVRLPS